MAAAGPSLTPSEDLHSSRTIEGRLDDQAARGGIPIPSFVIFLCISASITALSWRSLARPRSHGFWRFFAFELLGGLILLNAPVWFVRPLSPVQLASWSFGAVSIALAIEGSRLLRVVGRSSPAAGSATDIGVERTTRMVTVGTYRYMRHPLYSSLIALTLCALLKRPSAHQYRVGAGRNGVPVCDRHLRGAREHRTFRIILSGLYETNPAIHSFPVLNRMYREGVFVCCTGCFMT